jgi:protein TIF31
MVSRATKHLFSRYLRKLPLLDVPNCVAHLLNCLVGSKFNPCPQAQLSSEDDFIASSKPEWADLNPRTLQEQVAQEVFRRYRYRLDDGWWKQCKCIVLLREVCLKMGFQLEARDYIFEKPELNGSGRSKKSANGTNGHKAEETTFSPDNVLNVVPIIKEPPLKV